MKTPFTGGCLCGEIRYEYSTEPELMYYCHCTDCRKANGTAFHTGIYIKRSGFRLTSGTTHSDANVADSGRTIVRHFCGHCGAHIYSDKGDESDMISLKSGSLDKPETFKPYKEIWAKSKVSWADLPDDLKSYAKGPFV